MTFMQHQIDVDATSWRSYFNAINEDISSQLKVRGLLYWPETEDRGSLQQSKDL